MGRLIEQRYLIRHNLPTIIGFCLFIYFTYHIGFGERSLLRLMSLERQKAAVSLQYDKLHEERLVLESRVIRLRPGSIDPDLLEERARHVLGYTLPDEQVIIKPN